MKVAFVGLGAMGRGMAASLLRAGHEVTGFDLNIGALEWLEAQGGRRAGSVGEACREAEALVMAVVNGDQARTVMVGMGGAAEGLAEGAVIVSGVTMAAAQAETLGQLAADKGWLFLDAPISGGTARAADGTLTIMAAGSDPAWAAGYPLMEAMGAHIFRCGDAPGPGSTMKMVHQLAAGTNLAVAAEVMSFGAHLGLNPATLLDVLNCSAGGSWMIGNRGPRMITTPDTSHSAVNIWLKDLGIVQDAARASHFPLPLSSAALQVFTGASGAGFGKSDDSQAIQYYQQLGGRAVDAANDNG